MKGAATITATYIRFNGKFQVLIRPVNAARITRVVSSEQDAIDLVRHFNRLGMAGVDLGRALAEAKAETRQLYPALREALPEFLEEQIELGISENRRLRPIAIGSRIGHIRSWARSPGT